jgi:hypothetical protein
VVGQVKGQHVIIYDDMTRSGGESCVRQDVLLSRPPVAACPAARMLLLQCFWWCRCCSPSLVAAVVRLVNFDLPHSPSLPSFRHPHKSSSRLSRRGRHASVSCTQVSLSFHRRASALYRSRRLVTGRVRPSSWAILLISFTGGRLPDITRLHPSVNLLLNPGLSCGACPLVDTWVVVNSLVGLCAAIWPWQATRWWKRCTGRPSPPSSPPTRIP